MSMNLECKGIYEVPIQIGTWDSYLIYSDKDGGELGVAKRLRYYFLKCQQDESLKYCNNTEFQNDSAQYWNEKIEILDNAMKKYKKKKKGLNFGVY